MRFKEISDSKASISSDVSYGNIEFESNAVVTGAKYKEQKFSVIGQLSEVENWAGVAQDTFMSLWDYDGHVVDYVKEKKTLAGYDGILYMPDEFI